jgi:hypothetical protein
MKNVIKMRDWAVNPKILCTKHLLGNHFEIHTAVGNLHNNGTWVKSLIEHGYLEPQNFQIRHDELVEEMLRRGYKHNSPLIINDIKLPIGCIDIDKSLSDLFSRCDECKRRLNGNKT